MNLNHRLAEGKGIASFELAMHRIQKPLSWFIPLILVLLAWWQVFGYFGQQWDTGAFSTAFVPAVAGLVHSLTKIDEANIKSTIILFGYIVSPVTFYYFTYQLTRRHLTSLIVGLSTLLPLNIFSASASERLILALQGEDGAHILGLTFVPLAAASYLFFVRSGEKKYLLHVGLWEIVVSLMSFFAQFVLLFFYLFITLSEVLIAGGKLKFYRFGQLLILHLVISIVVYNLSIWGIIISEQGQTTIAVLTNLLPLSFFIVPVVGTFAFLIFDRRPPLQPLFIAGGFTLIFGLLHWVRISFVDVPILQQDRWAAEVSFATALLVGIVVTWIFDLVRAGKIIGKFPVLYQRRTTTAFVAVAAFLLLLCISLLFIPHSL